MGTDSRIHSVYARLGASRWSYQQQQDLQARGSWNELMKRWDDIIITRRSFTDDLWVVGDGVGRVLDKAGVWHEEPQPSSRSTAFLHATRHTLDDAVALCKKHGYWQDNLDGAGGIDD